MRKIIYSMSVSLDGFFNTPSRSLDWAQVDEELHTFFNDQARSITTSLYGRRMYELMTDYWPTAETDPSATPAMVEFGRIWKDIPRVVFSRTLERVDAGSRLVNDEAVAEAARLKSEPGGNMDVGGAALAGSLIEAGLVDEYRLLIHPVILGAGHPFFPPLKERVALRFVESRTFKSGVVYFRYETVDRQD